MTNTYPSQPSLGERLQDWLMVQVAVDPHLQNRVLRFLDVRHWNLTVTGFTWRTYSVNTSRGPFAIRPPQYEGFSH